MWDAHRHRVAPEIHEALQQYFMGGNGNARVQSAHLVGLRSAPGGAVLAKLDVGKGEEPREEEFDFVVNCTGPNNCEPLSLALAAGVVREKCRVRRKSAELSSTKRTLVDMRGLSPISGTLMRFKLHRTSEWLNGRCIGLLLPMARSPYQLWF